MRRIILSLILLTVFLVGCGTEEDVFPDNDVAIYAINSDETSLTWNGYDYVSENKADRIQELLTQLQVSGKNGDYLAAIPASIKLLEWKLSEKGILTCYFDAAYYQRSASIEILTRAAIVKTLCQMPDVFGVEFVVGAEPLQINKTNVGIMTGELFLIDIGLSVEETMLTLYYAKDDGTGLVEVRRSVRSDDAYTTEQLVLEELIAGPKEEGLLQTIPPRTVVNRVVTRDTICYVDFDSGFMEYLKDVDAHLTIYSIVNSLCDLADVSKVVFSVNGATTNLYLNMNISEMFERSLDYVLTPETE